MNLFFTSRSGPGRPPPHPLSLGETLTSQGCRRPCPRPSSEQQPRPGGTMATAVSCVPAASSCLLTSLTHPSIRGCLPAQHHPPAPAGHLRTGPPSGEHTPAWAGGAFQALAPYPRVHTEPSAPAARPGSGGSGLPSTGAHRLGRDPPAPPAPPPESLVPRHGRFVTCLTSPAVTLAAGTCCPESSRQIFLEGCRAQAGLPGTGRAPWPGKPVLAQ